MSRQCKKCYLPIGDAQTECPNCGANNPLPIDPSPGAYSDTLSMAMDMPMKWFKFIIYFQLFASCVLNGIYGIWLFTLSPQVEGSSSLMLMFLAVLMIAMAIFALVARSRLANFCYNGPSFYYGFLATNILLSVVTSLVSGFGFLSGVQSALPSIVMLICSYIYFNKRIHLFVN